MSEAGVYPELFRVTAHRGKNKDDGAESTNADRHSEHYGSSMLIKLIMLSALGYLGVANSSVIDNARYAFDKIRGEKITAIEMQTIRRIIVYYHTEHERLPEPAAFTKFLEENTR